MAGLERGSFRYSNSGDTNKSFIHLKITESAHKALEEYFQLPTGKKIVISGNGVEGGIRIPTSKDAALFKFIIEQKKGNDATAGCYECVHEAYPEILSKGALKTVRLQATSDSYENHRQSVANILAQNDKNCIKELKPSGGVVRHRPTRPTLVAPPRKESTNLSTSHYSSQSMNGNARISKTSPNNPPRIAHPPMKKPPQNPALLRKPIRERVIHMLALRPMKKPEIMQLLHIEKVSDGIKETDKKRISNVIQNVAILRDNCYHLQKHLWSDVQEDWPFFSEEERNSLKKRKADSLSPSSGSVVQPKMLSPPAPVHPAPPKRPRTEIYEHTSKRTRIEHQSSDAEAKRNRSKLEARLDAGHSNGGSPACSSVSPLSRSNSPLESGNATRPSSVVVTSVQNGETSQFKNGHGNSQALTIRQDNLSNYIELFPPINNLDERRKYKSQFKEIYVEYNGLFNELNGYKINYASLQKDIAELVGTPEYDSEKCRVVKEFEKITPSYRPKKERYNFLHKVLLHLKLVVGKYDSHR